MAITKKIKVTGVQRTNDEAKNVTAIQLTWTIYDTIDPETSEVVEKWFALDPDNLDVDSSDYIPFEQLTNDQVYSWISERLGSLRISEMEQNMINAVNSRNNGNLNPPAEIIDQLAS